MKKAPKWTQILLGVLVVSALLLTSCVPLPFWPRIEIPRDTVAIIGVSGAIQSGEGGLLSTGGAYSDTIIKLLKKAQDDPSVKAIVLRVDSPGGGVTACDEIYNEIIKTREVHGKVVVASMGSMAASGGYYISAAADRIVASRTTLTGSIGVITIAPNISGLLEKLGIETYVFKSGAHKDFASGLRAPTEEEREIWQSIIDDAFERFVEVVASGRDMDIARVEELADGRLYTAKQALENRLIDRFGDLDEAVDLAAELAGIEGQPRVKEYKPQGLLKSVLGYLLRPLRTVTLEGLLGLERQPVLQYLYIGP